jgi:molecular chaperone GrpE
MSTEHKNSHKKESPEEVEARMEVGGSPEHSGPAGIDELKALRRERDELYDRVARLTADFQNSRRRLEADKEQSLQFANSALIQSLIPVIDNFERALAVDVDKSDVASILKGLQVVHDQWLDVLKRQNVEIIAPEPGTPFDPTQHQALIHEESQKYKEPTVTQLLVKGYALHGRTLRPAAVAVSK